MNRLFSLRVRPGLIGLLIVFSLIVAACSSPATAGTYPATTAPSPATTEAPPEALPATGGGTVQVANNPEFGQILVNTDGMTLYTNTVDTPEDLRCTNIACTNFWPPYTVDAEPTASEGISGSLGTVTRPDGSKQVTYNQQPLYTFYLDRQPGDTKGDGFVDLGGTWHVVTVGSPSGTPSGGSSNNSNSGAGGIQY
jgi:predicted lipoprotein with Yx(FWY)xxD motif